MPKAVSILYLALAYVVTGYASLLLASPPGFVSGIFLPMGISLGAILIWGMPMVVGVLLGSFLLNVLVATQAGQSVSLSVLALAAQIAAGSSAASVAGALLIRHYVGFPDKLTDERKIFGFFIFGGPVATSISAACGAFALYLHDIIHFKQLVFTGWTWWIGDAIGVLIATPLMCIAFAEPRRFWHSRRYTVGAPIIISSMAVVVIFVGASNNEQKKLEAHFRQQAAVITHAVDANLSAVGYNLATLRGLFIASDRVTREEFSAYVRQVIPSVNGVTGFAWSQYVPHDQRGAFERALQAEGLQHFHIKEKSVSGVYENAAARGDYVVISFAEPDEDHKLIGINLSADPPRAAALVRARDTGALAMTEPLQLLQHTVPGKEKRSRAEFESGLGVVIYYPVYSPVNRTLSATERRETLAGFATAMVRIDDLVLPALSAFSLEDFEIHITDVTDAAAPVPFFSALSNIPSAGARPIEQTQDISFGGRRLSVKVIATEAFLQEHRSLQSWFVLAGGLIFCSLLGGFLLLISGREQHVRDLVDERTKELAAVLEQAVESVLVADAYGRILRANPAASRLFGYSNESGEADSKLPEGLQLRDLIPSLPPSFSGKGAGIGPISWCESFGIGRDGTQVPIELSVSVVELQDRRLLTVIIHDATEKRKMDTLKNEFISTVSHELRTPLTSIKGALGIALNGGLGELEPRIKDMLIIANNNADRLTRLVNNILDIDKLESGNIQLNNQHLLIYPLLEEAIEQNQGYAARYGVRIEMADVEASLRTCAINIDHDCFLQVMSNLVSNAIKYSHLGGVVTVSLARDGNKVLISVVDEGQGIPAYFRERIFTKFAQVDSSNTRRRDGTGLGLSITKALVERSGGQIDYHSVEGEGSRFFFTLPTVA